MRSKVQVEDSTLSIQCIYYQYKLKDIKRLKHEMYILKKKSISQLEIHILAFLLDDST